MVNGGAVFSKTPRSSKNGTSPRKIAVFSAVQPENAPDDFFESEGLTVLYRESPAYLDEAMPLNIYTSMFWYVKLSRCGLVLNRNLPIEPVGQVDAALTHFNLAQYNKFKKEDVDKSISKLKENRFLTMGQARYRFGGDNEWKRKVMKKVEELFK